MTHHPCSMAEIAADICKRHGQTLQALKGPRGKRPVSDARLEFMHLARLANFSTTQIGRFLGNRDHTTVVHGSRVHRQRWEIAA